MGHADFRANGRVFASLDAAEEVGVAIVTPSQQRKLRQASPAFAAAAGAWGKRGVTTLALAMVYADMAAAALSMAWECAMAQEAPRAHASKAALARKATTKPKPDQPAKKPAKPAAKAAAKPAAKSAKKPRVVRRRG